MSQFSPLACDLFGEVPKPSAPLASKFLFPPFSVLDARAGEWQQRKDAWKVLGIRSEVGREGTTGSGSWRARANRPDETNALIWQERIAAVQPDSIFDPVLCELAYRWFCPDGGQVVDPFAGGSVRGVVAALLGFNYWGCDLRQEQITANREQATLCDNPPVWECGDALKKLADAPKADFIFSCPPYGDLERYSDDPADLSTMEYHTFLAAYKRIVLRCYERLSENRFACFVVGDYRDKTTGHYRGFVADTINAFREVGFALYNDAVLITAVGSLPLRASAPFNGSRKLGKTHQNVLVFVKGDARRVFA